MPLSPTLRRLPFPEGGQLWPLSLKARLVMTHLYDAIAGFNHIFVFILTMNIKGSVFPEEARKSMDFVIENC